ncbi:hypothetical protein [Methylocystis echinoides]|nr:hypothetical protein [Methylocystis echinoides]
MSYNSIAPARNARVDVTASGRLESETQKAPAPAEKTVVIFTQPDEPLFEASAKTMLEACASGDVSAEHHALGLAEWRSTIENLRREGKIGDASHVVISMHGAMATPNGASEKQHLLASAISTLDFIKTLREPLEKGGAPCSATIYIGSCAAGDNAMRASIQELHNQLGVGACVLLSGSKDVLDGENNNALRVMCEALARARKSNSPLPSPDHIFAMIAPVRGECITLIEANRAYPLILHAPQDKTEFGCAPLLNEIHQYALHGGWSEPDPNGDAGEGKPDQSANRKPRVSGDPDALRRLESNLRAFGVDAQPRTVAELQVDSVLLRIAWRSDVAKLRRFLKVDQDTLVRLNKDEWNAAHSLALKMLSAATEDSDQSRSAGKTPYILNFLREKAHHFHNLDETVRLKDMRSTMKVSPDAFRQLLKDGFWVDARDGVSRATAMRPAGLVLAENGDLAGLNLLMRSHRRFRRDLDSREINDSHRLVLEMLDVAQGAKDSLNISLELAGIAREARKLLVENAEWIRQQYPRAHAYLKEYGFFGEG